MTDLMKKEIETKEYLIRFKVIVEVTSNVVISEDPEEAARQMYSEINFDRLLSSPQGNMLVDKVEYLEVDEAIVEQIDPETEIGIEVGRFGSRILRSGKSRD